MFPFWFCCGYSNNCWIWKYTEVESEGRLFILSSRSDGNRGALSEMTIFEEKQMRSASKSHLTTQYEEQTVIKD